MPRRISKPISSSGLRAFFQRLVRPGFASLGIADREVVEYVVDLLTSFARTDQLYASAICAASRLKPSPRCW